MSYQTTVNAIRTAAQTVNSAGTFRHGRSVDASQGSISDTFPLIQLFPFQINKSVDPDHIDRNTILMGFWQQDRSDTSPEEREALIAEMDDLVQEFLEQMGESKYIRMESVTAEPQYQMFQGKLSGMALRFTMLDYTPCVTIDSTEITVDSTLITVDSY